MAQRGMRAVLRRVMFGVAVVALVSLPTTGFAVDFDGDGEGDYTVYRGNSGGVIGTWFFASSAQDLTLGYQWGLDGDFPVAGKYTNSSGADLAVWRPSDGVWYLRQFDSGLSFNTVSAYQWGLPGADEPFPCDFNGDNLNELATFRDTNGTWYLRNSATTDSFSTATAQQWGLTGDIPVPADYDMDGKCDYAVFRAGSWFIILSSTNGTVSATVVWGDTGDTPVPGQYTSDNITDFAVYRDNGTDAPSWLVRNSTLAGLTSTVYQWGINGDLPVPFDQDGDGKTDIAVFRPSNGTWYVRTSSSSYASAVTQQFGADGDIPVGTSRGEDPDD